ncbi:MAG: amino acid adenylation domain-containing protein, partial [Thiotrichaceae bacterium]|nr:amino acid adenylation domain-containing protein [Thiotrichaceae bacterium]
IYTSGTTGKPKGAMNTHGGICNRLLWMQKAYQLTSNDQVLQKTPFSFDVSVWEFFWPLLNGAHLVIAKPGGHKDSEYLVKLIKQQNITTLHFVPSMLQIFIQEPDLENCHSLKRVICSGEALPFELQERFFAYLPTVELHNLYGPTEAAVDVTYWQCQQDSHLNNVPIGRPIANIQIYILDPYLQHVPIGVYGELHIAGVGLARGYLNRSDFTQEKFIKNPFSEGRLYKTGDLARYLPDGNIEYLSRIDNQVKIRGFRIELGEIETELTQYTGVLETVVRVQEDSHQQRYIVAYVVLETQSSVSIDELRLFLNEKLPDYMVPAIFLILDALPLTHHGKIDYRALPIPESARSTSSAIFAAPRLLEEELLAEIWGNVLDLEQIGIYDNFFDLGGNSIRSIQIIAQAKEVGLVLSLQQLFQHQTIYELARLIHKTENNYSPTPHIEAFGLISDEERLKLPKNVENAYPLATLQAGMLFHSKYNPETSIYHDVFSYYLKAPFEPQMLRKAIKLLIKRHPVLRTSFATLFKEPLQLVHQEVDVPLSIEDLCHLSKFEQEKAVKAWIEAEKKESFDWTHPPLLRFQIHRRSNDSFNLTLSFHHAILDGWSVASLITELFQQYFVLLGHNISILESQNLTFCDFIALERLTLESKECRQYWLETLQDFTVLTLPRWPVSCSVSQVGLLEVPLSLEISNSLKQLARDARVPIKNVLLAAHLKVLSVLSNKTDILTGLVSNGRPEETGGERVLGLFLNTLACRIQLRGGTWMDLVQETFKIERNALPYRRFPLAEIQRMLESGDALFETVFNFTHFHVYQNVLVLEGVEVLGGEIFEETNFTFAANFSLDLLSNQVALSLNYDASEFCVEQINAISGYYIEALSAMATQPSARYENHSLLSQQEQRKLLVDWNNTRTDYPKDLCMHQLFEMQVEKTPNAIAVVFENQQLTYQELNCKANQLAHYLQTLDIKPDILVGIYLKRSLEMVIGLLGILKAGGAYLSLDPAYPVARLAFMLEDAQIPVLLTQSNLIDSLPNTTAQKVCLDAKADTLSQLAVDNPSTGVLPSNLVYVIYTSGSTGKPKGVLIEHQGLCNLADAQTKMVGVQSDSRILQFASLNFDGSIWEIVCLCSGAQLNLASSDSLRPGPNLMQLLHEQAITHLTLPPTALAVMPMEKLLDLQYIIVAGEACSPDLIAKWSKGRHFFNGYGPTEATVCATIAECTETQEKISIGRPIANTQTYILDPHLQLIPIGVPGELHISSVGLARGYLNRPDLTAEKFIGNPFSKDPNSRLYKTGDLARYLPDGNIEYVGRIDNQVKIRGFRIELGEIETVLGQHPSVQDNAVIIQNTLKKDKRVVAYIVQHPKQVIEKTEIRAFLKERLPDYMIPLFFVILEALPLTQTGKIDRQILSQLSVEGSHFSESFVAPRDTLELQLTQIWEDVLNIHPIGIHDNFFELGGHSLLAVSLMAQIEQLVNKTLSLAILFEGATIEQLANILRQQSATQSWSSLVAIQPNGSKPPFFCIPGAAGNVIYFYEFSRLLGTEQPFYGLQAVGLDGESEPHTCIEEMAAHYIKEIQTVQPHGPYLLGGHSLGAFIALEMSFQLQKQGEVVALLTIFDQPIPQLSSAAKTTNWDDAQYLMFLADLIESMLGQKLNIAYDILQSLEKEEQFRYFYERLKKIKAVSQNGNIKEFYGLVKVLQMGFQTGQSYKPEMTLKIPRIALLRTTDTIVERDKKDFFLVDQNEPCWGWDQFSVKTVAIHLVPGDHITMMTPPHVQTLTEKLNICFEQALENN